ncbi:N/A [soil metagenome]
MTELTVATDEGFFLGDGPFWDPIRERLLWVDIRAGTVLAGTLRADGTISIDERVTFPTTVGAVAVSASGDWVIAGGEELLTRTAAGVVRTGPRILPVGSGSRLNDGKPDPAGRYMVGSLRLDGESTTERLVVVQPDGDVEELDTDLALSNGLGWSPDGSVMYSIDTMRRTIFARPYDTATGTAGDRHTLVTLDDGYPDGMCVDVDGYLWVAVWGLGQVRRYSPAGELERVIDVPAPHTSCVAFAGPDLDTLVITSATQDLTAEQLAEYPLSGRLFTHTPGVRGLPQALWKGTP